MFSGNLFKGNDRCSFKNYSCYYTSSGNAERTCGGTALLINSAVPHMPLSLNTNLQATAASLSLDKKITLCSLYLPLSIPINVADLDNLISQLPKPFLLLGDFNSHNTLWGCNTSNQRGRLVEDFITKQDLCLFNDKFLHIFILLLVRIHLFI